MKHRTKKVNRAWLNEHIHDPYVKLARTEGYRARAAYKLKEIDERFGLVRPGAWVVDLGSVPGAWSQYVRRALVSSRGAINGGIIALDILPMEPIEGVYFLQGDFCQETVARQLADHLERRKVDLILSDMAPNLSGIASSDSARTAHLVELALDFARNHLKPSGTLVVKLFHGSGYSQLVELYKRAFRTVKPYKPKASRDKSNETFLVAMDLKAADPSP